MKYNLFGTKSVEKPSDMVIVISSEQFVLFNARLEAEYWSPYNKPSCQLFDNYDAAMNYIRSEKPNSYYILTVKEFIKSRIEHTTC